MLPVAAFPSVLVAVVLLVGCTGDRPMPKATLVGAWPSSVQFETGAFASPKDLEFLVVFNEGGP